MAMNEKQMLTEDYRKQIKINKRKAKLDGIKRSWYKFSRNKLSVVGLALVILIVIVAVFEEQIAPYPEHAGSGVYFEQASRPPCAEFLLGTDTMGRDVLSRIIFSFRNALIMGITVVVLGAAIGTVMGLLAGYFHGKLFSTILLRITDVFLSLPSLVLALVIAAMFEPSLFNCVVALTIGWWTWYVRLIYGQVISIRSEYYVQSAELIGASRFHILIKEILPNCLNTALTKMTLDLGLVILMGATLSFVGLGEQAPAPDLGTMINDGYTLLPGHWWLTVFPACAIMIIVLAFNLVGDGISDMLGSGEG